MDYQLLPMIASPQELKSLRDDQLLQLADEIVRGVRSELERVDERIRAASKNWRLERMTRVDRNLLRIGTWELIARPDVPRAVVIDEAVELAKRYGTEDSGAFVNGVLDRVANDIGRVD